MPTGSRSLRLRRPSAARVSLFYTLRLTLAMPVQLTPKERLSVDAVVRGRLLKQTANNRRGNWQMVIEEAGLQYAGCQRTICDTLRQALEVQYRLARQKIGIGEGDAQKRMHLAKRWARRPTRHWTDSVRGFVDNKNFETCVRHLSDTYQTPIRHLSDTYVLS